MSQYTKCNYCTLEFIRAHAAKSGATVEVRPAPRAGLSEEGVDIYIHYPQGEGAWSAWFMKLTDHCVC